MKFFQKLSQIDRRWIYLLVALAVIVPLMARMGLPDAPGKYSLQLFDAVDRIPPRSQPVLISADYSPSMMPELHPMFMAMARHCLARKVRLMVMTLDPTGAGLAENGLRQITDEINARAGSAADSAVYGRDYVFLGYKPGTAIVMMSIGENIRQAYPADAYGTPLDSLPMMRDVRNYADIPLVNCIAGSAVLNYWIVYAGARYRARVGGGSTAVSSADYYPFLQSGQMVGLLNGMKGASDYEFLNQQRGYSSAPRVAGKGMDAVSIVHLLIMGFIVLGNVGYFVTKKSAQQKAGEE
ncbi:MAG: hypothetical protein MUF78_06535 [Candidatus Edwardsbacteria bacterium]|jgi:hypothetical protein|nr:hypothetical protein [Candidatus Edwardsbacteria bacterium]